MYHVVALCAAHSGGAVIFGFEDMMVDLGTCGCCSLEVMGVACEEIEATETGGIYSLVALSI
jgi:hypothetical protein